MSAAAVTREIERIASELEGFESGSVSVRFAEGRLSADEEGEAVTRFSLVVSDPPSGSETWPLDDLQDVRRHVRGLVMSAADDLPYPLIAFYPETSDAPDDPGDNGDTLADALDRQPPD